MWTDAELKPIVRAVIEKLKKELPMPKLQPATVQTLNDDGTVTLAVDGDEAGVTIGAEPLVAGLAAEDRVMVMFQPPRACFVIGVIQT